MSILTSPDVDKIAPALVAVQAAIRAAGKSGENLYDKYKYAKLEDYLHVARPLLAQHGLSVIISINRVERLADRQTVKGGVERAVEVQLLARLSHSSGQFIEIFGVGEGQDRADKAVYKAITGGKKYLLAGLLAIPTTDDPEADETVGETPPPKKPSPTLPKAPAVPGLKARYDAAMAALGKLTSPVRAQAFFDDAKSRNPAATDAARLSIVEELEARVAENTPEPKK
jgi:hypothetical protein